MSDLLFDLRDQPRVVDFMVDVLDYADAKSRGAAEPWIMAYQNGKRVGTDELAEAARALAIASWPARDAVKRFFDGDGATMEWESVCNATRPSTGHLLKRFCEAARVSTLDAALKHAESDLALQDAERIEIASIRAQFRIDYWKRKKASLSMLVENARDELMGYLNRLDALRELGGELPSFQDEIFSKIKQFEDRILFAGERLPIEVLDDEIRYYTDQKEIPADDTYEG